MKKTRYWIQVGFLFIVMIITMLIFIKVQRSTAPDIPKYSILHPTFATEMGEFSAGTFFLLQPDGDKRLLAITALHIFGPKGGLQRQYGTEELKKLILDISVVDAFDQSSIALQLEPFQIFGASVVKGRAAGDVAAFFVKSRRNMPFFRFSKREVKPGDRAWLATSVEAGDQRSQKAHAATVLSVSKNEIKLIYDNQKLEFRGTSGSPVLDKNGDVIGINVGAAVENGKVTGYANPAIEVEGLIQKSLKNLSK